MSVQISLAAEKMKEAGFTLLELIMACTVASSLFGIGAGQLEKMLRRRESQAIAYQLRKLTDAANQYVRDHYESIHQVASSGFSSQFTVEDLKNEGYLESTLQTSNSFKQTYQIKVAATELTDQPSQLSVLVLSQGGIAIPQEDAQNIAGYAGGDAGYIDCRSDGSTLSGTHGTWVVNGISNVGVGHVGSLNFVRENEIIDAQSFLLRKSVRNHPEYNQMQTDLDMQSNLIQGAYQSRSYQISAENGLQLTYGSDLGVYTSAQLTLKNDNNQSKAELTSKKLLIGTGSEHMTEMIADGFYVTSGDKKVWMDSDHIAVRDRGRSDVQLSLDGLTVPAVRSNITTDVDFTTSEINSGVYPLFLKLPSYEMQNGDDWWDIAHEICGNASSQRERYGRAFMVAKSNDWGFYKKRLIVCSYVGALAFRPVEEFEVALNSK